MSSFFACLKVEIKKLTARKKYMVLSVISALICIASSGVISLIGSAVFKNDEIAAKFNISMMLLPMLVSVVLPLIAMMAVCDLFAAEFGNGTIRGQLLRPVGRFSIYLSKVLAPFLLCLTIQLLMFGVSLGCTLFLGERSGILYALFAYILDLVPVFILILMAALINQITKSPVSSMFLCIIIYIAAKASGYFSAVGSSLLFTSYSEWHRIWIGSTLPVISLLSKVSLLAGYGLTFLSGGYLMFVKGEY